jgi:threonine/homoserine/homoserine lactone efflux protein
VLELLYTFAPVAAVLTLTPGAATALVVRSAALGGRRAALRTTVGNSLGVLTWAALAALGVAAVVAASAEAFAAVKLAGAVVLILLGAQTVLRGRGEAEPEGRSSTRSANAFREGLLTSILNPKLAVFFVALFPQFVPDGAPVLPAALLMAAMIVAFDLAWYSTLAYLVARAKRAFVEGPWLRRAERFTGVVLIGLGARLALERR